MRKFAKIWCFTCNTRVNPHPISQVPNSYRWPQIGSKFVSRDLQMSYYCSRVSAEWTRYHLSSYIMRISAIVVFWILLDTYNYFFTEQYVSLASISFSSSYNSKKHMTFPVISSQARQPLPDCGIAIPPLTE
jgi:hypothetical protein